MQLFQRARERSQLRAALALEEAGELQEAARLFEYVGEHPQAAALRLEHAQTLRDERSRLQVLREGAARNPGSSEQGQALHRALAKALATLAEGQEDGALQRGLRLEAAEALEEADEGADAGEIYESLGLLPRAARAYEAAGAISRLEVVLALLDRQEQAARALDQIEQEIERALKLGRRKRARRLLEEHGRERLQQGRELRHSLARLQSRIEAGLPRRRRLSLRCTTDGGNTTRSVRMIGGARLRIGRAPDAEFVVHGAALSREHVDLRLTHGADGAPALVLEDRGSRAGTFWNGDPIDAGTPQALRESGELGLGIAVAIEIIPGGGPDRPTALLRAVGDEGPWTLYAPLGGPVHLGPGDKIPALISFDDPYVELTPAADLRTFLDEEPLGVGAPVELLLRDRIVLRSSATSEEIVEIDVCEFLEQERR
jgi:tetratricopeptide (TPR) repeat protein